jgi:hypothetical protein
MQVHFNLVNGSESIQDEEGIEVSDVDHAKAEALKVIQEMRSEKGAEPRDWAGWRLAATDQSGTLLFLLDLALTPECAFFAARC